MGIPDTYQRVEQNPQGFFAFLKSPIRGMMDSIDVILFILIIGGFIGITHFTGAFDVGIAWLAVLLKGRENLLIVLVTSLIALGRYHLRSGRRNHGILPDPGSGFSYCRL